VNNKKMEKQITGEETFEEHKENCGCCEDKSKEAGE